MTLGAAVDSESSEVVLFGDERGLRELTEALRRGEAVSTVLDRVADRPVLRGLARLQIAIEAGPVHVDVDEPCLRLRGAAEHLASIADAIDLQLEHNDVDDPGFHFHVTTDDHSSLAQTSRQLVVAGLVPDDR